MTDRQSIEPASGSHAAPPNPTVVAWRLGIGIALAALGAAVGILLR